MALGGEAQALGKPLAGWRLRVYTVIFEADTRAGRLFDQCLIAAVLLSVAVVIADSVQTIHARWRGMFTILEWTFTLLFTLEYLARLACVRHPLRYAISFFGIVGGIILTLLVRFGLTRVTTLEVEISWLVLGITTIVGLIGGVLGALYPAMKAARLDAVEALSYE